MRRRIPTRYLIFAIGAVFPYSTSGGRSPKPRPIPHRRKSFAAQSLVGTCTSITRRTAFRRSLLDRSFSGQQIPVTADQTTVQVVPTPESVLNQSQSALQRKPQHMGEATHGKSGMDFTESGNPMQLTVDALSGVRGAPCLGHAEHDADSTGQEYVPVGLHETGDRHQPPCQGRELQRRWAIRRLVRGLVVPCSIRNRSRRWCRCWRRRCTPVGSRHCPRSTPSRRSRRERERCGPRPRRRSLS